MKTARLIEHRGKIYKLKPSAIESERPVDLESIDVTLWIIKNTYARGYSKAPAQGFPTLNIKK